MATKSPVPRGIHWFWWVVAVGVVIAFAAAYFFKSSK